jgi:GT2 family glycosyltransferase
LHPATELQRRFPRVRWLTEPTRGSYWARNKGLAEARGEIMAFTDSDCIPAPEWVENIIRSLEGNENTVVGGAIKFIDGPGGKLNVFEAFEQSMFYAVNHKRAIEVHRFAVTANLAAHRSAFHRYGPFDSSLYSSGDREWTQRAQAAGAQLVFAPNMIVRHPRRRTFRAIAAKIVRLKGGMVMLSKRTSDRGQLVFMRRYTFLDRSLYVIVYEQFKQGAGLMRCCEMAALSFAICVIGSLESLRVYFGGKAYAG